MKDHPTLGEKHTIAVVRPGNARNFLVPKQEAVYATIDNRIKFNLLRDTSAVSAEVEEAVAEEETAKKMNNYVNSYVQRLSKVTLSYIRIPEGKGIHKPVTRTQIVTSLHKDHQFPGITPEQVILPLDQTELNQMGKVDIHIDLCNHSLLPGVGLCKEFEDRAVKPVQLTVNIWKPERSTEEEE